MTLVTAIVKNKTTVTASTNSVTVGGEVQVKNTDSSFDETYTSVDSPVTLPNITLTDSDGVVTSIPSNQDVTCSASVPVTEQVNGVTIGTAASGGTNDQIIQDSIGGDVGTSANPSVVANATVSNSDASFSLSVIAEGVGALPDITVTDSDGTTSSFPSVKDVTCTPSPDATVQLNGSTIGTVASGATGDFPVTQDGSTVGSWNGSAWIIPPASAAASVTIGVFSDAGHTTLITEIPVGTEVFILSEATGSTPDNHLFFTYEGSVLTRLADQSGSSISWTPSDTFDGNIYVVSSDSGSSAKAWNKTEFEVTGDADAAAFISAAGITDATQKSAILALVTQFKADSIWSKLHAIYPMVGGSSSAHKYNLKNPLDTDAAFRLTFSGGITHGTGGIQPNGTNGYADTHFVPFYEQSLTSSHFSLYSRTSGASTQSFGGAGIRSSSGNPASYMVIRSSSNSRFAVMWNESTGGIATASSETDARGFYLMSRTDNNLLNYYKNASQIAQNTDNNAGSLATNSYYLGVFNQGGSPLGSTYDNKQIAFSTIGSGLSNAEQTSLYNAVQAFQTSLSRNV